MTDLNHWYIKKGRGRQQQSWYLLFVKRKGIKLETLISIIDEWGALRMFTQGTWKGTDSQRKTMIDHIELYWAEFIEFVTLKTGIQFKKRPYKKHRDYDDWWQENNLNGGFAYNGVTDDF